VNCFAHFFSFDFYLLCFVRFVSLPPCRDFLRGRCERVTDCKYAHDVNEQQRQMAMGGAGAATGGAAGYGAGNGYGAQPSYGGYGQTDGNGVYAAQGEQTYAPSSPSRAPGLDGDESGSHAPLSNAGSSRKRGRDDGETDREGAETTSAAEDAAAAFGGEAGDERPSKQHKAGGGEEEQSESAEDGAKPAEASSALLDGVTRGADGKDLGSESSIGGIEGGPNVATPASAGEAGGQIDAGVADVSTAPGDAAGPSGAPGF